MGVHVFISDDGTASGTGPMLFLADEPKSVLPENPRALVWRYVATVAEGDSLLAVDGLEAQIALKTDGYFIANRLLK